MVKKLVSDWRLRNILFLLLAIVPILPFIIYRRFQMDWDAWFHFSRMYEIVQNISRGKFALDVSYFSFNNQGYAVNFFYPYFINYPIALIWLVTKSPVFTVLLANIIFRVIGLNIAFHAYDKWQNNKRFAFLFSILFIFGYSVVNVRLLNLGTYNQQLAYFFLPYALLGIYQLIFGKAKDWQWLTLLSLTVITLSHLLTTFLLVIYAGILLGGAMVQRKTYLNPKRILIWAKIIFLFLLTTAIFIVPMLEQKGSNDWWSVPALNLNYAHGMLSSSVDKVSLMTRLESGFAFKETLWLIFMIMILVAIGSKKWDKTMTVLIGALGFVTVSQSNLIPWYLLQRISVIDMIQTLNRFDFFLFFFVSLFITYGWQNIIGKTHLQSSYFLTAIVVLYGLFLSQNFDQQKNGIIVSNLSYFDRQSYLATDETIYNGLANSNFGYFSSWAGKGIYRINGFMDYRAEGQLVRTVTPDGQVSIDDGRYQIKNGESNRPMVNIATEEIVETNDFIENAVYFDRKRQLKKFSQTDFSFYIKDIPNQTKIVQTPITYLKGFMVKNENGETLNSYKNSKGWLEFEAEGNDNVIITYEKTKFHQTAIVVSLVTWVVLSILFLTKRLKHLFRK